MKKIVRKTLFVFCSLSLLFNVLQASFFEDRKKAQMIQDLEVIKHHFEAGYAPAEWKKEYTGWDLNEVFEQSKNKILTTPSITTKQFQQIVRDFVKTTKDYHVDVTFFSTESSSLPFSIKGVEGRYFIDWVDPMRLPVSYYGIRAGDELLKFDQRPIAEVMTDLIKSASKASNPYTDLRLAEMKLTIRSGMVGDDVPKGPIMVTIRSVKTGQIGTYQLHWSYTPEHVKNPLDFLQALDCISLFAPNFVPNLLKKNPKIEFPKIMMANPLHQSFAQKYTGHNGGLGSRKSSVPVLGALLWSNEENLIQEETEENLIEEEKVPYWYAYIYQNGQGEKIGYIRIPCYAGSSIEVKEFGEILNLMEEKTDALVIDQLHNFGGFVHFQYALIAMLTDHPLETPYHRIKITQKEVIEAYETLELIKLVDLMLAGEPDKENEEGDHQDQKNEKDQEENEEKSLNYQEILFLKAHCELVLEDWNKGLSLTRPTHIIGIDKINPHPKYRYSKPILMLIDEMDFSGADFIPAILQDNQRALLFGMRTAGAGGYVFKFQFPNSNGIAECSYTASIAERVNLQKIENLGVTPDIEYHVTLEDMQDGYKGYAEAVNQAVQILLKKKHKPIKKIAEFKKKRR